jgi:transposase
MQRVEIHLKNDERIKLEAMCSSGVNQVRSLQRAQILLALDKGISDHQIADVLNIDRISIWRIRKRYLKKGLEAALYDGARSGRPVEYGDIAEAEIVALACSNPPAGQRQ